MDNEIQTTKNAESVKTEEKSAFKWKSVEVKLIGENGDEKIFVYQNPRKIEMIKGFMWSISKSNESR